jgi:phage/plasmid-like protein (TIGR03299 family)
MSRETLHDLNTNTLIGNTDQRGSAWHYRAEHQGDRSNHYPGAIPVEDVQTRLFHWRADSRRLAVEVTADLETMTHLDEHSTPARWEVIADRQAIARSDRHDGTVMGIFGDGYVRHQYAEWLLTTVANLLDDNLTISSAGVLRGGAVAWVEVSVPESITTPEGVTFRANLLATTSFDGSIATTFKRTVTDVVCDNTRELALSESGQQVKVKHSRYSHLRITDARDALAMVHTLADDFAAEVAELCAVPVSRVQWEKFLDAYVPNTDKEGQPLAGRSATSASNKRAVFHRLYGHDLRVAPWSGTAHGVLQAVNTYEHHEGIVRGADRAERNMLRTVTGDFGRLDHQAWRVLCSVL